MRKVLIIGSLSNKGWQLLQKCHKKMNAPYFKLYDIFYLYSISCLVSQILEKFFGVEFYRTVSKFRKIIGSCFLLFPYSTKEEIGHFYSVILQQCQRKVQKCMMQVQRALLFCQFKPIAFLLFSLLLLLSLLN